MASEPAGRIVVHSLDQAKAALGAAASLKRPVVLASGHCAGAYAGPAWFKSLVAQAKASYPGVEAESYIDCGDSAGAALAALRHGFKRVGFSGNLQARASLDDIARAHGAQIENGIENGGAGASLDLAGAKNPARNLLDLCKAFLAGESLA
jgi:fructose/tagatose bisphosphate aldolase